MAPVRPRVYAGFDYANGDADPADGRRRTFDQLFPLAHAYLGFMDLVGRQNIVAVSGGISFAPADRVGATFSGHHFSRAETTDALYNAGGRVVRAGQAGTARSVGSEIDVTINFTLNEVRERDSGLLALLARRVHSAIWPEQACQLCLRDLAIRYVIENQLPESSPFLVGTLRSS